MWYAQTVVCIAFIIDLALGMESKWTNIYKSTFPTERWKTRSKEVKCCLVCFIVLSMLEHSFSQDGASNFLGLTSTKMG